jgi:hypothetical protein
MLNESQIDDFELRIMDLEQRLRPIADRPVDITKPGWGAQLAHSSHPLDEAGVRSQAGSLLEELIGFYHASGDRERQAIRALFVEYRSFAWAASLPFGPGNEENLRRHLLLFSIKDQGRDSRDALLWLQDLCREARNAGVDPESVLREAAKLSSDKNKYGMGSTMEMLLRACET